ncbi:hypothetical protein LTR35_013947 [Friedmanniomyces endolithicus]|uniref:DUF7492 domain-containing protein n=1 Tax=Friedmanniomyces endolithicus TaxID=329885 RepID=A0AAN6J186_9PEZI|nr:hypothetical protein LTR35_013947 [Friedmanniomyces endolithicus]KAK0281032.1 hypothetical protein LTS00_012673 [Friedmanniomyces endolithicus]KAK0307406.1 hypothetical protein LTR82_015914 [Friedmanniomyces endolithicus]
MFTFIAAYILALAALTSLPTASAHSWNEEFQVISTNGTYIGDRGFPRGYMARTDPGYNGFSMEWLVPQDGVRISSTNLLCHPAQQTSNYSNPAYPKLQVTPGSYVAMKYLENGHVTLPWNQLGKPPGGGTVFVYGTTQPSDDEKIADVLSWTSDGKGGNGKGFLMTAQNFDDGRCYQINCGNISTDRQTLFPNHVPGQSNSIIEQWCETDVQIPTTATPGTLSVYWVWQWPTEANHDCTYPQGKDEYYTTCSDFDVIAADGQVDAKILAETDTTHTLAQENPQTTAVSAFQSRIAFTSSPPVVVVDGTKTVGQLVKAEATFMSACSATGNVKPDVTVPANCAPVSIFTGAAVHSASQALQQFATTNNLAAPAAATNVPAAAPVRPVTSVTNATVTQTAGTSTPSGTQTVTTTTTVDTILTMTVTMSTSSIASSSANTTSIVFATISTVTAPSSTTSSPSTSMLTPSIVPSSTQPPPTIPSVGPAGIIEDVVVGTGADRNATEHIARHAHRRHARYFK